MDLFFYLFLYFILNADTMKKAQRLPEPEEVQTTADDSIPPIEKPKGDKPE